MKIRCLVVGLMLVQIVLQAQQTDTTRAGATPPLPDSIPTVDTTLATDSTQVKKGIFSFFTKDYPNPKKAAYLSLALPGTGQMYNKRWWKVPLVYGALGGMVYTVSFNQKRYREFRDVYQKELRGEEHPYTGRVSANTLRLIRDRYDKRTQLSYFGLAAVYALQVVEAFVDAHLKTFDVSEDLSLQVKPSWQAEGISGQPTLGVGVALRFE